MTARALPVVALCAAMVLWGLDARADQAGDLPPSTAGGLFAGVDQFNNYWYRSGLERPFFAATFEAGAIYMRPTAHIGYGRPHYRWIGLDIAPAVSTSGVRMYSGFVGVTPNVSARLGARYESALSQSFLTPSDDVTPADLDREGPGSSRYLAIESEFTGRVTVPGGNLFGVLSGYHLIGVPEDVFVFEEALRVVAQGPWLWRGRLGYLYQVDFGGTFMVGAAAEVIHEVQRKSFVVRAGPAIRVVLTDHLSAIGSTMIVITSPDSLGLRGASVGELGLRYRWATGDWFPGFP